MEGKGVNLKPTHNAAPMRRLTYDGNEMTAKSWTPGNISMDAGQFRTSLEVLGITPDNLSAETGVHRSTLFRYMNGSAEVTPLMVAYLVLRLRHNKPRVTRFFAPGEI